MIRLAVQQHGLRPMTIQSKESGEEYKKQVWKMLFVSQSKCLEVCCVPIEDYQPDLSFFSSRVTVDILYHPTLSTFEMMFDCYRTTQLE